MYLAVFLSNHCTAIRCLRKYSNLIFELDFLTVFSTRFRRPLLRSRSFRRPFVRAILSEISVFLSNHCTAIWFLRAQLSFVVLITYFFPKILSTGNIWRNIFNVSSKSLQSDLYEKFTTFLFRFWVSWISFFSNFNFCSFVLTVFDCDWYKLWK